MQTKPFDVQSVPMSPFGKERRNQRWRINLNLLTEEKQDLAFKTIEYQPGVMLYVFAHVVVVIDTTYTNFKDLPELYFGTYDETYSLESFRQPATTRPGIDMPLIINCMMQVSIHTGLTEAWIDLYGDDAPDDNIIQRQRSRLKLFKRATRGLVSFISANQGYIIKIVGPTQVS